MENTLTIFSSEKTKLEGFLKDSIVFFPQAVSLLPLLIRLFLISLLGSLEIVRFLPKANSPLRCVCFSV